MRYSSIDILRTIAIVVMVIVHFSENLSGITPFIAGLGAPLFAFLSGMSYRLWLVGQQSAGKSELEISKVSVRRGLFVFCVGFAFNILVWLPEDTFNWDVLTFIGAALLLLNFLRRIPLPISALIAVLSLLVSPLLQSMADYESYWTQGYFEGDWTLSDLSIGFLATGYFPFFPWITYTLAGYVTATLMFVDPPEPPPPPRPLFFLALSIMAAAMLLLLARPYLPKALSTYYVGGWEMFPPTIPYVAATVGMAMLLFACAHRWVDLNAESRRYTGLLNIAKTFSRYSLTIYVAHHVVHLWPLWIYAEWHGYETTHFWQQAMPLSISLPLAFVFLALCYVFFRWVGPDGRYGIEAWMRWLCD